MKRTLQKILVTGIVFILFASLLIACETTPQQNTSSHGLSEITVGRCSKQFWPVTKGMTRTQPSSQSVYFISGIHLYSLNAGNGAMRWCVYATVNVPLLTPENAAFLPMKGPPPPPDGFTGLTVSNDIIYACSMNDHTYAFDTTSGSLRWKQETSFGNTSAPTVVDDIVYVGSGNIYALNAQNGSERWQYPTRDVVTSSPVVVNGVLYAGSYSDHVYALDVASGKLRWQYNTGGRVYVDPIVADGVVFFGAGDMEATLYAVNAQNGKLLWHNNMTVGSSLAVANGILYVGSSNYLYALNPRTGAVLWRRPMPTPFNTLIVNGVIYAASNSGGLYAFNASNGTLRWHNPLNPMRAGQTTIPVLLNGEIYIETLDLGIGASRAIIHALNASNGAENWYASVTRTIGTIGIAV